MFDVIGKRRFFYIFSLLTTIPGLIFILLTPFTDAGLQFTIDYTGGTRWEIRFENAAVTPEQVESVFAANDLEASAVRTGSGYIEIKTEPIGLQPAPVPTAAPSASAAPSGSPGASASPAPGASASASAAPSASASASPAPSAAPAGNTELPTSGKLGEMAPRYLHLQTVGELRQYYLARWARGDSIQY